MSEDKSGKAKITVEVEVNEALMAAAKEWKPRMGWMGPWGGMGSWRGSRHDGRTNARGDALEALSLRNAVSSVWRTHA